LAWWRTATTTHTKNKKKEEREKEEIRKSSQIEVYPELVEG
jgi:hypothetical protein